MTLAIPSGIGLSGKLNTNPWPCVFAVAPNNDVEKAPLLTVGGAQIAAYSGIAAIVSLLLMTYTNTQVLVERDKQTQKEITNVTEKVERLEDRVTTLESMQIKEK